MDKISFSTIRGVSLVPDQMRVVLKYNQVITMVNVAGIGTHVFRLNSLFDPDLTGTGHQPLGFDQWATLYGEYQVMGSRIKVRAIPPDTNPVKLAVFPSITSTVIGSVATASEQPYSKSVWINNINVTQNSPITSYISVKKLEGRNIDSVNFIANTGTNPAATRFWQLTCESNAGTAINDILFDVTITYYCHFLRRLTLTTS